jgi:hypothetical protein
MCILEAKLILLSSKLVEEKPLSTEERMLHLELLRDVIQLSGPIRRRRPWSQKDGNPPGSP